VGEKDKNGMSDWLSIDMETNFVNIDNKGFTNLQLAGLSVVSWWLF
jgi:hypothetical protein